MKVVRVRFYNNPTGYDYFCDFEVAIGDYVVVPTNNLMGIAKVTRIGKKSSKATKLVIQKIDTDGYQARLNKIKEGEFS